MRKTATTRVFTWNVKSLSLFVVMILAMATLLSGSAAACGRQPGQAPQKVVFPGMQAVPQSMLGEYEPSFGTIVGLWHVTYTTSDNQPFQESYDMWHRDGLEMETANVNPVEGNTCVGVWKQVGTEIRLHHVGWSFDPAGNLVGPFTVDDVISLGAHGRSYSGSFDFKQYDTNGTLQGEVAGTVTATRIEVN